MKQSLAWCSALVALAAVAPAHADSGLSTFERTKPHVSVAGRGHVDLRDPPLSFDFLADIDFGPNRPASGGMQVVFADGSVRLYTAVAGMRLEGHACLVFFLGGIPSGELDPTDPAIAVLDEDPRRRRVIAVKLQLKQLFPDTLNFAVPGEVRLTPARGAPMHARPWFSLHYPPQRVPLEGTDMVAGFSAWTRVRRDRRANGYVVLGLPDGQPPLRFDPLFATVVPETETGPGYIIILMALEGAPLQIETLAIGTVRADPIVPGCDIWDFTSNVDRSGSPFHIVFHAERHGDVRSR